MNAVLNGGFSATFTKAQQEFVKLGAEIKALQAIQRDVTAWQKQDAAVKNTTAKLENLKKQEALLVKQLEAAKKAGEQDAVAIAGLEREKLKLAQRIDATSAALEKQENRLKSTEERLDAAGLSTENLSEKNKELTDRINELTEEQKKVAEGAGTFGSKGVQAVEAVAGAIAAVGIAAKVREIADAYHECVDVSMEFGQSMSNVEAIAGATRGEMAALTAEAKELGATTKFTAVQSADAMGYMAMAGWNASEMLAGMKGMTTLAAAAGEDLAQVSDIVTDNLTAFGLRASDTAHFADVLAAAAANSNTNIAIMGETFKSSSAVAGALGYSVEDVAVMVGLMANNAVKGSRAGTALRNIFNGLLGGVTLTAEAFGELEYSAVNSDGSMKGLMETVKDLRRYFGQMTQSEKVGNAMNLAGMRGYNGLLAILNATDEDFQNLYASINDCAGAAERMASVKLDNLSGDVTIMNSAMEALQTTIGEQFNPELRELTQLKTELLNGINESIKENPALMKALMAAAGGFMAVGTAVVGVNAAVKVFQALNLAALFSGPAGALLGVAAGIASIAAVVVGATAAMHNARTSVDELTEAAMAMETAMAEAGDGYANTAEEIQAKAAAVDFYIEKLKDIEAAEGEGAEQNLRYQGTLGLLLRTVPELSSCISQTADEFGRVTYALDGGTDAIKRNVEEWQKHARQQANQAYLNSLYDEYGDLVREVAKREIGLALARDEAETAGQEHAEVLKRMKTLWAEADEKAKEYNKTHWRQATATNFLTDEYYELESTLTGLGTKYSEATNRANAYEEAVQRDRAAVDAAEEVIAKAENTVNGMNDAMGDYADAQGDMPAAEAAVKEALDGTMARVKALAEAYEEVYEASKASFSGQFGLFSEAKADEEATLEAAQAALETQLAYWQNYAANIAVLKEISNEDLGVTKENYEALMAYVRSGSPEMANLAAEMVRAWNDGDVETLTNIANKLGWIRESQEQAAQDITEWTLGMTEQMDQLVSDMKEEIVALDLSEEAAKSGRKTIQSYVDEAASMLPQVRRIYGTVARQARHALAEAEFSNWDGIQGYADGTDNAPPGWSWVGEDGPELMRMRGGEQILPNRVSREAAESWRDYRRYTAGQDVQSARPPLEILRIGGAEAGRQNMELHFHIEAGAAPETVNAWQDYASRGGLKEAVMEILEDAAADRKRRAFA